MKRLWCEDEGILTFEWILLLTIVVIGVIGGMGAIRDAINSECLNVASAIASVDPSYYLAPPTNIGVSDVSGTCDTSSASGFGYLSVGNTVGSTNGVIQTTVTPGDLCGAVQGPTTLLAGPNGL